MKYNIIVAPRAFSDLDEVNGYISQTLCAPQAARGLFSRIIEEIGQLGEFPFRGAKVLFSFDAKFEVRRLIVGEFLIFYRVDDERKIVYVLRIRYGRTDYINYLKIDDPSGTPSGTI